MKSRTVVLGVLTLAVLSLVTTPIFLNPVNRRRRSPLVDGWSRATQPIWGTALNAVQAQEQDNEREVEWVSQVGRNEHVLSEKGVEAMRRRLGDDTNRMGGKYQMSIEEAVATLRWNCRRKELSYNPAAVARTRYRTELVPRLLQVGEHEERVEYLIVRPSHISAGGPANDAAVRFSNASAEGSSEESHQKKEFVERGTIMFFHGCSHTAKDFCFPSLASNCPKCRALPEEVSFAVEALRRGFSVLAISARNHLSHCWVSHKFIKDSSDEDSGAAHPNTDAAHRINNLDVLNTLEVLKAEGLLRTKGTTPAVKPLLAMGASSGGSFVGALSAVIGPQLQVVVPQIAAPRVTRFSSPSTAFAFSVMSRDVSTVKAAKSLTKSINEAARSAGDARTQATVFVLNPSTLDPEYFSRRIIDGSVSSNLSRGMVSALDAGGHLATEANAPAERHGQLLKDPRHSKWRDAVRPLLSAAVDDPSHKAGPRVRDELEADKSAISEELNVAYALHEFHADFAADILDFAEHWLTAPIA